MAISLLPEFRGNWNEPFSSEQRPSGALRAVAGMERFFSEWTSLPFTIVQISRTLAVEVLMDCAFSEVRLVLIQAKERRGRSKGSPYWREILTKPPRSAANGIHRAEGPGMSSNDGSLPIGSSDVGESCQSRTNRESLRVGSGS